MRLVQRRRCRSVVEHERLAERRARPRRRSPGRGARRAEPALSHSRETSPGSIASICDARRELPQLVRRSGQERERPVVARDDAVRRRAARRPRRLARIHREVAADRQDGDVGRVEAADQLHVAEHAGVAGEVDLLAVLELDDDPAGLPDVYEPSSAELEWKAFVSVNFTPSASTVPPLFGPGMSSVWAPWTVSQSLSSTMATIGTGPCFFAMSTTRRRGRRARA